MYLSSVIYAHLFLKLVCIFYTKISYLCTMGKRRIDSTVPLDLSKFANMETGEMLESEGLLGPGARIVQPTDLIRISYKDYMIINDRFFKHLSLSNSDVIRLTSLGGCLRTEWNVCFNGPSPHTRSTLAKEFDISAREVSRFISRMRVLGLIRYDWVKSLGYNRRVYMVNPFAMRSRKQFSRELLIFFKDWGGIV